MGLFGKSDNNPKNKVQDWIRKFRKEIMSIDRQIRNIEREEVKTKMAIKKTAKQGGEEACRSLAKELINSRRTVDRLVMSKTRINSVIMIMNTQLASLKISGNLAKSSDIMRSMQGLVSVPELSMSMKQLSKEMVKAGIMEEMIGETMDSLNENRVELDDEENKLVEELLFDTTGGKLGKRLDPKKGQSVNGKQSTETKEPIVTESGPDELVSREDASIGEMEKRLEALRS